MLVPRFALAQTEREVLVTVKLPYVRVGDAELSVEGQDFVFYCKPYLLKLHFPHALRGSEEDEGRHCRAVYDADLDHGTMTLHLEKATPGQHFPDLDLTTSLLQPVRAFDPAASGAGSADGPVAPTIEVLRSEEYLGPAKEKEEGEEGEKEEGRDDETPTTAPRAEPGPGPAAGQAVDPGLPPLLGAGPPRYGFNRAYSGVFKHLREEAREVLRVPDPETTPEALRTLLREAEEAAAFDGERYLGDLVDGEEDPVFQEAMALRPFYLLDLGEGGEGLAAEEREELASLRTKRELLPLEPGAEVLAAALTVLDLLLAFAYDWRTSGGEPTVESPWTLAALSPALAWLETYRHRHQHDFGCDDDGKTGEDKSGDEDGMAPPPPPPSVAAVVRTFYRRSLSFPYLRLWALSARCVADARAIVLQGDRRLALRCLLRVRRTLRRTTEGHYLLARILLDDLCVFMQHAALAEPVWAELRRAVAACPAVEKGDVGLDLPGLEALLLLEGEESSEPDSDGDGDSEDEDESSSESESDSGGSSSDDEEEDEEEDGDEGSRLAAGLERVSLGKADGSSRSNDGEEDEEAEGVLGRLAALSVGTGEGGGPSEPPPQRETLDVRAPPSLLVAPGAARREEGAGADEGRAAGQRRPRPLVEELS